MKSPNYSIPYSVCRLKSACPKVTKLIRAGLDVARLRLDVGFGKFDIPSTIESLIWLV